MELEDLKHAVSKWKQVRTNEVGYDTLIKGDVIHFQCDWYSKLQITEASNYFHFYFGLKKNNLEYNDMAFFMVAEEYDTKDKIVKNTE